MRADWGNSPHAQASESDIVASLDALPVNPASFDAVLCTEVLEHLRHPDAVLAELARVLVPGGRLCLTVPFVWPLHEEPFDFFRYTPFALSEMLQEHGFPHAAVGAHDGVREYAGPGGRYVLVALSPSGVTVDTPAGESITAADPGVEPSSCPNRPP